MIMLAGLSLDADTAIADAARASIAKMPDKMLGTAMGAVLPVPALEPLARALAGRDEPLERIVVSRDTPDDVIALIAANASERISEIIAGDQQRLVRSRGIVAALKTNAAVLKSSIDRIFDFLVRSGVIFEEFAETGEALARLSATDFQQAAEKVDRPPEVAALIEDPSAAPPADAKALDAKADDIAKALEANVPAAEKEARVPMLKLVATLNIARQVGLASRGTRQARALLGRDANTLVAVAAIKSPRITEAEVKSVAGSRTVHDDVIRIICNSREMTRSYSVKLALAGNPKTPLQVAMRFLPLLRDADVKLMSKSKAVPAAIAMQAKRMTQARSSGGSKE